jgi:hypothetical protein
LYRKITSTISFKDLKEVHCLYEVTAHYKMHISFLVVLTRYLFLCN